MNVLYIDHYAGSDIMGMEFRPFYMAREWKKAGHNVLIVAADYSHLRIHNPEIREDFQTTEEEGVRFLWLRTGQYSGNGVARAMTMLRFCRKLYSGAKRIIGEFRPDAVIASSTYPLDAYPARHIAKLAGAVYFHEVHDLWPLTLIELSGMSRLHPFVVLMQWAENFFCKKADGVVSVLPCADKYLERHGLTSDRFHYISNGIVLSDWEEPEPLPRLHKDIIDKARLQGRFILTFFGSHTKSYNLDVLLQAAENCKQEQFLILFVGDGNYKKELTELSKKLEPDSVAFTPPISKRAIPSLIAASDASYVGAAKNRMFRFGIGMNKLFDAMMGAKPILYAVDAPNDFIREYGCGISVDSENPEALASGLSELMALSDRERNAMGERGREAVLHNFNYAVLAEKFVETIEKAAAEKR